MTRCAIGSRRVDPGPGGTRLRQVMRCYPTGVVVVAAMWQGRPYGMAVNSFASVSLDPPLVMFCADHGSTTWPHLRASGRFAVSILGAEHADLCRLFATKGADRFAGGQWSLDGAGSPVLDAALAWLSCEITAVHPGGDHDIVLATVSDSHERSAAQPLVFHRGGFTSVESPVEGDT